MVISFYFNHLNKFLFNWVIFNWKGAMFITTFTTALAFFATAICPVAPIVCFATFLGLLVVFDYLMNILLVFPALCMYDKWIREGKGNCCINIKQKKLNETAIVDDETEEKGSLIHRILNGFYNALHKARWPVVLLTIFAITICAIEAFKFKLPASARIALLKPGNQFEQHYNWNEKILSQTLSAKRASSAVVVWGVRPADTGNHLDPSKSNRFFFFELIFLRINSYTESVYFYFLRIWNDS